MSDAEKYCAAFDDWAERAFKGDAEKEQAWRLIRTAIRKSCLLDRVVYLGEQPSQTPCPVHKGLWAGVHHGWPNQTWSDGSPVEESVMLRKWYDAGCRCYQHKCGCTTGWQPDEHCGCKAVQA